MARIDLFEAAVLCNDDICQRDTGDVARIDAMVRNFAADGFDIVRHNMTMDPNAFVEYREVGTLLVEKGESVLPITMVDGKIVKTGVYPTALEFAKWFAQ
ncbi:MAG: arsenic metallochaperone ArsD family protein [Eubacteriaceae bacterium]|jgi:hypothetical protein|nr:arsenic metallochaperone ArsD family protein [Eubacteriaceae bacterium]